MNLKIFKIKKHFKKGGIHINPDIFWGLSLIITLLIVLASFVSSFLLFNDLNQKFVPPAINLGGQTQAISKEKINKVLEYFAERQKKSNEILNSKPPVIDPSH